MSSFETTCLRIFHYGSFERVRHLLYIKSEAFEVYINPDYVSVDYIKENVVNLGYSEDRIKELYFSRPSVPFEESLVPIQSDKEVKELIRLCSEHEFVCIYVEHNDYETDKGKQMLSNEGRDQNIDTSMGEEAYFLDVDELSDDYDSDEYFNSNDDDPEF